MRYYDTQVKNIVITFVSGMGEYRTTQERNISVSKETDKFVYGFSWDGRYKLDKAQNKWYRYYHHQWEMLKTNKGC